MIRNLSATVTMSPTPDWTPDIAAGSSAREDRALPAATLPSSPAAAGPSAPARVLVIDDDDVILELVARTLERAGHQVLRARHGKEGLALFAAEQPDAVITDIFMPDQDGIEVITALARQRPGIPILAISGGSQLMDLDYLGYARRLGARDALAKPFAPSALMAAVEKLLADLPSSDCLP